MTFNDIKEALPVLVGIITLSTLLYFFYNKSFVRKFAKTLLPWLPTLFRYLANKTPDKPRIFDQHDWYVLGERVSRKIGEIISDPSNLQFSDVEEELSKLVADELKIYRDAGVSGVPELSSEDVKEQTRIIFSVIKRLSSEDTSGNDR